MTRVRRRWVVLVLVAVQLGVASCGSSAPRDQQTPTAPASTATASPSGPPSTSGSPPSRLDELGEAIDGYLAAGSVDLGSIRAIQVSRQGELVAERYYRSDRAEHVEVQSVTKSVVSTLVGIALRRGELRGLDQNLAALLPQHRSVMTAAASRVTLRQLLTMCSGWTDDVDPRPAEPGLVQRILRAGPDQAPGTFRYANAPIQLVAAVLVRATGMPVLDYARRELFGPLGIATRPAYEGRAADVDSPQVIAIDRFRWLRDPDGVHAGPFGLALTAADMIKVGRLWLDGGVWNGRRLLAAEYVTAGSTNQVPELAQAAEGYGYLWWDTPLATHRAFSAVGQYGQLIAVIPDLQTVVVVSARASSSSPTPEDLRALLDTAVVPYVG